MSDADAVAQAILPYPPNPKNPVPDNETSINIFGYTPSLVLGIVGAAVFVIAAITHITFLFIYSRRAKRLQASSTASSNSSDIEGEPKLLSSPYTAPGEASRAVGGKPWAPSKTIASVHFLIAFGSAMEFVGYGFRIAAHYNPFVLISFVLQYFMIVVAPVFFSASIYLSFSAILRSSPSLAVLSPLSYRVVVWLFIVIDVVTIAAQVIGAALFGTAQSAIGQGKNPGITSEQANWILLAGLCVQCFAFLIFLANLFLFTLRYTRQSREASSVLGKSVKADRTLLLVLVGTSLLILLRTLFRLGESAEGNVSAVSRSETAFGLLEAFPVLLAVTIWTIVPFGKRTLLLMQNRFAEKA